jgi:hypothetical protein
MANKKKSGSQQHRMRVQQTIFAIIALMIILVMVLSLVAK